MQTEILLYRSSQSHKLKYISVILFSEKLPSCQHTRFIIHFLWLFKIWWRGHFCQFKYFVFQNRKKSKSNKFKNQKILFSISENFQKQINFVFFFFFFSKFDFFSKSKNWKSWDFVRFLIFSRFFEIFEISRFFMIFKNFQNFEIFDLQMFLHSLYWRHVLQIAMYFYW